MRLISAPLEHHESASKARQAHQLVLNDFPELDNNPAIGGEVLTKKPVQLCSHHPTFPHDRILKIDAFDSENALSGRIHRSRQSLDFSFIGAENEARGNR